MRVLIQKFNTTSLMNLFVKYPFWDIFLLKTLFFVWICTKNLRLRYKYN